MATPENDRIKRKTALRQAREKLALRKKEREQLRLQRAKRMGGKIDTSSETTSSIAALNSQSTTKIKKKKSLLSFGADNDKFQKKSNQSSSFDNKASLYRQPGKRVTLSTSRQSHYKYEKVKRVKTFDKRIGTDFEMFANYLIEEYKEEFPNESAITSECKSNLMQSVYRIGWPRELWLHEKSLSPSPQSIIYGDDDEYIEQLQKIELLKKQEKERKERQHILIEERRKLRLAKLNRTLLPKHEQNLLINTGKFLVNFRKKAKWMQRTLGINSTHSVNQSMDIFDDDNKYDENEVDDNKTTAPTQEEATESKELSTGKDNKKKKKKKRQNLLRYMSKFECAETEGRAVSDINFSKINNDWFISSYFTSTATGNGSNDGLIMIWNLLLPSFPEYKLYSETMITSAHFHPIDPFLIFASTISGQILCWDVRKNNNKNYKPMARTNFNDGHCSPIFAMNFLPNTNIKSDKRHVLSLSNDGKLCIWKDDGLSDQPMHEGELKLHDGTKSSSMMMKNDNKNNMKSSSLLKSDDMKSSSTSTTNKSINAGSSSSQELSTTCFSYQYKHSDIVVFGSDSGKIYKTDIHQNAKSDGIIYIDECLDDAHYGPITNVDFQSFYGLNTHYSSSDTTSFKISDEVSGLYLTSSYDWTVKLWHNKYAKSICTFNTMSDYIYDVKWCNGGKPGVFACCDGESKVTLFDLKKDFKEQICPSIKVPNGNALTKLQWGSNGKYLSCGDSNGSIYLYLSSNKLLYPRQKDFDDFQDIIQRNIKLM